MRIAIYFIICSFLSKASSAQLDPIETDRPDQTESPFIVPPKYFQFEFGINMEKDRKTGVNTTTFVLPTGLLKYGINNNVELRVEFQSLTSKQKLNLINKRSTSLEPVEVGLKARLWEEKGIIPKTSFIIHTTVPAFASKTYKKFSSAPNFRFTMQNSLSDRVAVGYNAGMEWNGEDLKPSYTYTIAPGFTFNSHWAAYIELFGFINRGEAPEHSVDGGLYYFPGNNIKLDISAGYGLTKIAPDFYIALGCSFRLKP